jgi:ABC-type Na+ transport system ATPase subunit NatA
VFGTDAASQPMRVRPLIGYVPQLLSAGALLTGHENVELFARLFGIPRPERRERVDAALSAMGLTEAASRLVKTCSTSPRWALVYPARGVISDERAQARRGGGRRRAGGRRSSRAGP